MDNRLAENNPFVCHKALCNRRYVTDYSTTCCLSLQKSNTELYWKFGKKSENIKWGPFEDREIVISNNINK